VPYRALAAFVVVAALAGCGTRTALTTHGASAPKPHRLHAACPKSDRRKPASGVPGAQQKLVPGHPGAVLVCRYSGLNGHPRLALIRSLAITDAATVTHLAHELNALPPPSPGAVNCPADFADAVLMFFAYAHGPADPVSVGLSGCQDVANGHLHRLAGLPRSPLPGELERLTR
jgi:hypothetical protein